MSCFARDGGVCLIRCQCEEIQLIKFNFLRFSQGCWYSISSVCSKLCRHFSYSRCLFVTYSFDILLWLKIEFHEIYLFLSVGDISTHQLNGESSHLKFIKWSMTRGRGLTTYFFFLRGINFFLTLNCCISIVNNLLLTTASVLTQCDRSIPVVCEKYLTMCNSSNDCRLICTRTDIISIDWRSPLVVTYSCFDLTPNCHALSLSKWQTIELIWLDIVIFIKLIKQL